MLNRRDLLKLFGVGAGAAAVPAGIARAITKVESEQPVETPVEMPVEAPAEPYAVDEVIHDLPRVPRGGRTRMELQQCTITLSDGNGDSITIAVGEGNLTWTEHQDFEYQLERGCLDSVRVADEQPMDVSMDILFDYVKYDESKFESPLDILRQTPINELQMVVGVGDESYVFDGFNWHTMEWDMDCAALSISGVCNESTVTRTA